MTKHEAAIIRAAIWWWKNKRPCAFTAREHLDVWAVNIHSLTELRLAKAVATAEKARLRSKGKA